MSWATDLDTPRLLGTLTAHGVDFVVVGGIAAVLHGSARVTQDLDVCFAPDEANRRVLAAALAEVGAQLRGVDVEVVLDERLLRGVQLLTLETDAGALDVMLRPDGCPPYARLRRNAERYEIGAFAVLVASIPDLIAMKQAAGRLKDLADVAELEAIQRLRR
jgi:Nucleotidyl transferase AbiEii toxin, Type IV TA system